MKLTPITTLLCFLFLLPDIYGVEKSVKRKDTLQVVLYETSMDFRQKKNMGFDALVITEKKGDLYFYADKVVDTSTGKRVNDAGLIWAMEYNGDTYLNMGYMEELTFVGMYIKFDIAGNYCALKFDERFPEEIVLKEYNENRKYALGVVGGVTGALLAYLLSDVKNVKNKLWLDDKEKEGLILFCDTMEESFRNFSWSRNGSCLIYFFTEKDLKNLLKKNPSVGLKDEPKIEDVLTYFRVLNDQW